MCGIAFCLCAKTGPGRDCAITATDSPNLLRRGPDAQGGLVKAFDAEHEAVFRGYVLHMRGHLTPQPLEDSDGNVLLWNGEIFGGIKVEEHENDTTVLLHLLQHCEKDSDILNVFATVQGPWAFVYYKESSKTVWFGRDVFGRRSLLWRLPSSDGDPFLLSSVATTNAQWEEVPASIYALKRGSGGLPVCVQCYPWELYDNNSAMARRLEKKWIVRNSGILPIRQSIRYSLNPALPSVRTPTFHFLAAEQGTPTLADAMPPADGGTVDGLSLDSIASSLSPVVDGLLAVLAESVRKRVTNHADRCQMCESLPTVHCPHAAVAILFSGGIDSLVVAALADRFVPGDRPIDLINVAFQKSDDKRDPRQNMQACRSDVESYDVPDRLTGYSGLKALNSTRCWNFVEVNVPLEELQATRSNHIAHLVLPLQTVLDDSIGCAIWFAARGAGVVKSASGAARAYTSRAKVVLVGMGADEQLGGYSRHRTCFETRGWSGLLDEIRAEVTRISERNLGRDDRIISDHGKEGRFPFLDEDVVSFLNTLPLWQKMDLTLPRGIGEKLVLRLCALKLGLGTQAATLPKRAIQFGSRIAKLEGRSEKGSDVCTRFQEAMSL